jgi:uncharacterized membrane protein (UPF0182 family)
MRGRWLVALALGALALLAGRALAAAYADYLWFASLGASALWRERFWLTLLARGGSGVAAGAFVFVNLYAVRQSIVSLVLPRRLGNLEIGEEVPGRDIVAVALLTAALSGWLVALPSDSWQQLALARHDLPFGERDPYLATDLGFFVNMLPFETSAYLLTLVTALLTTALVTFFYALTPSLRWDREGLRVSQYARRHLLVLTAVLLLVMAWSFRLDGYRALLAGSGVDGAFSFTDHRAGIPANSWLAMLALGSAVVLLAFGWIGQLRVASAAVAVLLVLGIGLQTLWPWYQRRPIPADPAARELPYLLVRAEYSRRAFGVDRILGADSALRYDSPRAAAAAVSSWDPSVLLRATARRERGDAMAIGWTSAGAALAARIAVRAPVVAGDSAPPRWTIERVLAAAADAAGDEVLLPDSAGSAALPAVFVYDGAPDDLLIVADTQDVLPAPALTTSRARYAFAWSRQRLGLINAELPGPHPRALLVRDVRHRVAAIAPFFAQGSAVTPVVVGDSLSWMIDLYAVSATYPLSRRDSLGDGEYTYIHHAATAIVSAHTGRVTLLRDEVLDPLARNWVAIFPSLFADRTTVPDAMIAALPPAADGARAQARMLARFGRRGEMPPSGDLPSVVPDSLPASVREGAYLVPAGRAIAWTTPVLDSAGHLTGLVVATGGAARATYWFPLPSAGARWSTIAGQLKSALDSGVPAAAGARVRRGAVRVVPVKDGILFAQSVFSERPDAPVTLLRSAVLANGTVAAGRNVSQALGAPAVAVDTAALTPAAFRARVTALYAQMRAALQRGEWIAFGRAYDALGALLARRERQP